MATLGGGGGNTNTSYGIPMHDSGCHGHYNNITDDIMFLYSAVSSPSGHSEHFTNQPLAAPSDTNSTSLGSIQPRYNYCVKTINSHIARYSFIQLSELGHGG